MAKQIIILGTNQNSLWTNISCVLWYPITSGAKTQTTGSVWSGAAAAENSAIQAGTVLEEQNTFQFPTNLPTANMKAFLQQYYANRNAQINGVGPGLYQNVYDDNATGWSA
jgi:hypothetical protein